MLRRAFLILCCLFPIAPAWATESGARNRVFAFKIKTKDGGIVGNVVFEASDVEAAKAKLMKRYPGCTILSVTEK